MLHRPRAWTPRLHPSTEHTSSGPFPRSVGHTMAQFESSLMGSTCQLSRPRNNRNNAPTHNLCMLMQSLRFPRTPGLESSRGSWLPESADRCGVSYWLSCSVCQCLWCIWLRVCSGCRGPAADFRLAGRWSTSGADGVHGPRIARRAAQLESFLPDEREDLGIKVQRRQATRMISVAGIGLYPSASADASSSDRARSRSLLSKGVW